MARFGLVHRLTGKRIDYFKRRYRHGRFTAPYRGFDITRLVPEQVNAYPRIGIRGFIPEREQESDDDR
jgi:hypothetical protein